MDRKVRAILLFASVMLASCGSGTTDAQAMGPGPAASVSERPAVHEALASPDGLVIEAGDFKMRLKATACEAMVEGMLACIDEIQLDVSVPSMQLHQTLHPAAIMVRQDAVAYRGALPVDGRPEAHTFIISDVNADGHEDLLLWSGQEGTYGGPSFDVYLFDERTHTLRYSQALSELTIGYAGIFGVDGGLITTNAESGCCILVQETHAVEDNVPRLVERITVDSSTEGAPRTVTERLVDGKLQIVDAR